MVEHEGPPALELHLSPLQRRHVHEQLVVHRLLGHVCHDVSRDAVLWEGVVRTVVPEVEVEGAWEEVVNLGDVLLLLALVSEL